MEKMDKEPTVPKWVLKNRPKIPLIPQDFGPICLPKSKSLGYSKKALSGRPQSVPVIKPSHSFLFSFSFSLRFAIKRIDIETIRQSNSRKLWFAIKRIDIETIRPSNHRKTQRKSGKTQRKSEKNHAELYEWETNRNNNKYYSPNKFA